MHDAAILFVRLRYTFFFLGGYFVCMMCSMCVRGSSSLCSARCYCILYTFYCLRRVIYPFVVYGTRIVHVYIYILNVSYHTRAMLNAVCTVYFFSFLFSCLSCVCMHAYRAHHWASRQHAETHGAGDGLQDRHPRKGFGQGRRPSRADGDRRGWRASRVRFRWNRRSRRKGTYMLTICLDKKIYIVLFFLFTEL